MLVGSMAFAASAGLALPAMAGSLILARMQGHVWRRAKMRRSFPQDRAAAVLQIMSVHRPDQVQFTPGEGN